MKTLNTLLILVTTLAGTAQAASHASAPTGAEFAKTTAVAATSSDMAAGEIRKIDLTNNKVTIKHGEIKNLDMPGMTMVFQVKDVALLSKAKVGEKVRFSAEKAGGAIVVTDIQPAR
ncbi:copper-binding protein [Polaromonas sp.]|uniref:copper-binding protein n=1 Tax=Polaromonas sp. TaxID=1869339 RepID=UPI003566C6AF